MKKIIISFILSFLYTIVLSQTDYSIPQGLGGVNTIINARAVISVRDGYINAIFPDTTTANTTPGVYVSKHPAAQIYVHDTLWIRDLTASRWIPINIGNTGVFTNSNIGAGFQLAVVGTNNIKTLANIWGLVLDSMSIPNVIGIKIDTTASKIATKTNLLGLWNINGNIGTTGSNFIGTTDNQSLNFKVNNTAYGFLGANISTSSGGSNTALGYRTLSANTTGLINTAFGTDALWLNTTGRQNTAFGARALTLNNTGQNNVAMGDEALQGNSSGVWSTAVGSQAMYNNTTGQYNIAIGGQSLFNNTVGVNNTAIGYQALSWVTTGNYNVAVGDNAGSNISYDAKSGGVFIGHNAGSNEISSNKLYIANSSSTPLIYGNFSNPNVSINSGATADTISAVLSMRSTTKGLLLPRMTTTQMNSIISPAEGLSIWNTTTHFRNFYNGTKWTYGLTISDTLGSPQFTVGVGDTMRFAGDTSMIISFNSTTHQVLFHSNSTGGGGGGANNFLSSISFSTSTGLLTFARSGLTTLTQNIDGRYNLITDTANMLVPYLHKSDSILANRITANTNTINTNTANITTNTSNIALKQNLVTLTTTSTSGVATFNQSTGTLNIPNYGGGSGSTNLNVGTGFRLALPGTNNIKTIISAWNGLIIDSISNANTLTFTIDTSKLTTWFRMGKSISDSINAYNFIVDNANGTDSLVSFINSHSIQFKLPKVIFPLVLSTLDTTITWSMPSYNPTVGKILSITNSFTLGTSTNVDGNTYYFPVTTDTLGGLARSQTWTGFNTYTLAPIFSGGLKTNSSSLNSDLVSGAASASLGTNSDGKYLFSGTTDIVFRVGMAGSGSTTITNGQTYTNLIVGESPVTLTTGGTYPLIANNIFTTVGTISFTAGSTGTTTNITTNAYFVANGSTVGTQNVSIFNAGKTWLADSTWVPTASVGNNSQLAASTAFVTAAIAATTGSTTQSIAIQNSIGGAVVAEGFHGLADIKSSNAFGAGCRVTVIRVASAGTVLHGIMFLLTTAGNYTTSGYNGFGLYSYSGGTATLVASSTSNGTLWSNGGSTGWVKQAFSSNYTAAAGTYYLVSSYNNSAFTTNPSIGSAASAPISATATGDFTNGAKIFGSMASIASLPSTISLSGSVTAVIQDYIFSAY